MAVSLLIKCQMYFAEMQCRKNKFRIEDGREKEFVIIYCNIHVMAWKKIWAKQY